MNKKYQRTGRPAPWLQSHVRSLALRVKRAVKSRLLSAFYIVRMVFLYLGVVRAKYPKSARTGILFSVIIPIYDRVALLDEAIRSILDQDMNDWELLLVCDGSPPETLAVVRQYSNHPRVRVLHLPKSSGNAVRARNKGILEARGKFLAFLDSDDRAEPDRLTSTLQVFDLFDCDVVYGAWTAVVDGSRLIDGFHDGKVIYPRESDYETLLVDCVPAQSTVAVRRQALLAVGGYKVAMQYREDHELWLRLAHFGHSFKSTNQRLSQIRLHAGNNEVKYKPEDEYWKDRALTCHRERNDRLLKIVFLIPSQDVGGGLHIIKHHANILHERGYDVTLINMSNRDPVSVEWWSDCRVPVLKFNETGGSLSRTADLLILTYWSTANYIPFFKAEQVLYLIQSDERRFFKDAYMVQQVKQTYEKRYVSLCIASWLATMMTEEFKNPAVYHVPNFIEEMFYSNGAFLPVKRRLGAINKVIIEGPLDVFFKNVPSTVQLFETYEASVTLVTDRRQNRMASLVDSYHTNITREAMRALYRENEFLVKLSDVESFCLPALEAMASGCAVIIKQPVDKIEFLEPEVNCMVVKNGQEAVEALEALSQDHDRYNRIINGGYTTADQYRYDRVKNTVASTYETILSLNAART